MLTQIIGNYNHLKKSYHRLNIDDEIWHTFPDACILFGVACTLTQGFNSHLKARDLPRNISYLLSYRILYSDAIWKIKMMAI